MTPKKPHQAPVSDDFCRRIEERLIAYDETAGVIDLVGVTIDCHNVQWLVKRLRWLRGVRTLTIHGSHMGRQGAFEIARGLTGLTNLDIEDCLVQNEGLVALAEAFPELVTLRAGNNDLTEEGARHIARDMRHLKVLELGNVILQSDVDAMSIFMRNIPRPNVGMNKISNGGLRAIAESLSRLQVLGVSHNLISDAQSLIDALRRLTCLREIDVQENPLRFPGMSDAISGEILRIRDPQELLARLEELQSVQHRVQVFVGRIVLTGPTGHGKSHLARWLMARTIRDKSRLRHRQEHGPEGFGTWGVDRFETKLSKKDHREDLPEIGLRLFDCGGHPEQLQSHQNLYFSSWRRTVFVVCVRADRDLMESWGQYHLSLIADLQAVTMGWRVGTEVTPDDLANRPLRSARFSGEGARLPVVLVRTFADKANPKDRAQRDALHQQLKESNRALNLEVISEWSAIRGTGLAELKRAIGRQLANAGELRAALPKYVMQVRDAIQARFEPPRNSYLAPVMDSMSYRAFCELCKSMGIADENGRYRYILRELDNLGFLVSPNCNDVPFPDNPLVVNPQFVQYFLYQKLLDPIRRPADGILLTGNYRAMTQELGELERKVIEDLMQACLIAFEITGRNGQPLGWLIPDLLEPMKAWPVWCDTVWAAELVVPVFLNESVFFEFARQERDRLEKTFEGNTVRLSLYRNGCLLRHRVESDCQARVRFEARRRRIDIEVRGGASSIAEQWCTQLLMSFERITGFKGVAEQLRPTLADELSEPRHLKILAFLDQAARSGEDSPRQKDIARVIHVGEDMARLVCKELEALGLIHRPHGARRGYCLTERGAKVFAFHRARESNSE